MLDYAIALHGGAGTIRKDIDASLADQYRQAMTDYVQVGRTMLEKGARALEAVEAVVRLLEDDPKFNAGQGAAFTHDRTVELEATVMDGATLACGSVTGVRTVKNPVSLARLVMEKTPHVILGFHGVEAFADKMQVQRVDPSYFHTEARLKHLELALAQEARGDFTHPDAEKNFKYGTVGCVAKDKHGDLAAATSTGGRNNKWAGRIGDSCLPGAGNYADNRACAVSGTGIGEQFIRNGVGQHIAHVMRYRGDALKEAAEYVIDQVLKPGDGGVVAVDRQGRLAMPFNTLGMYRAVADSDGLLTAHIWEA